MFMAKRFQRVPPPNMWWKTDTENQYLKELPQSSTIIAHDLFPSRLVAISKTVVDLFPSRSDNFFFTSIG